MYVGDHHGLRYNGLETSSLSWPRMYIQDERLETAHEQISYQF